MRPYNSSIGGRLNSVAVRYRHPLSAADQSNGRASGVRSGRRRFFQLGDPPRHDGGNVALDNPLSRLEAILFLSRQSQTSRKLAKLAGLADGTKARTLIRSLNRRYDAEERAFRAEEVAGGFQLMTRAKFAPWLRRLVAPEEGTRLSASAMETLAVVAYRQPILRVEIESIRGVQSGEVLRQLVERDFVRIVGRSEELGRPYLYGTTKKFLQVFGIRHLDELPRAEILRNRGQTVPGQLDVAPDSVSINSNQSIRSQEAEEEENVKTLIANKTRRVLSEDRRAVWEPPRDDLADDRRLLAQDDDDEDDFDEDDEDDEDFDDEDFDDEDLEEEDEDLEDEPWEEVEDEDEEWDEDEDEDWEDEDWDEDEDEWDEEDEDEEDEEIV